MRPLLYLTGTTVLLLPTLFGPVASGSAEAPSQPAEIPPPYRAAASGRQKVTVVIDGGFQPNSVWVKPGETAELTFLRREGDAGGETLLLPSLGVKRTLRPGQQTTVIFRKKTSCVVSFTNGTRRYRGHAVVIPEEKQALLLARAVASGKSCCAE